MKVLCVTNLFPNRLQPNRGIYNWRHFAHLQRHAEIRVISPVSWWNECRGLRRHRGSLASRRWTEWGGVPVVYPRFYYTPGAWRTAHGFFLNLSIGSVFREIVSEFQPDVVYACWAYPDGWSAWKLARDANLPVVVKVHGSDLLLLEGDRGRRRRTVEMLKHIDALAAVSADLRDSAIALGVPEHRTRVIYEGTDCELFSPGDRGTARRALELNPEGRRLLFVGNLVAVKAVHNLIEASRQLVAMGCEFEVDIVGEGPLRMQLQRQIVDCGLAGRVHLRGPRPQAELPMWYRSAELVVLPSDSEGVPNVLVEAAACGIPFVATRVGGIPEIAHLSPARLVAPGDPAELARAIEEAWRHPPVTLNGRRTAAVPSAAACAAATVSLLSEVASAPGVNSSIGEVVNIPA